MKGNREYTLYVGGYAEPGERGILKCAFDGDRESLEALDYCDELRNPSWLLRHPDRPLLYAVEELPDEGNLAVLSLGEKGMRVLAKMSTRGADPCHIAIAPDGRHLLVSNYTGGSLAVFGLDSEGLPNQMTDFIQHRMEGAPRGNPRRQEAPHIHFSLCDGSHVYVNDLGLNRVFIYGWDAGNGRLVDRGNELDFPEGAGPRHLAFGADGRHMYVLCELDMTLHAFERVGDSDWRRVQSVSAVPEDCRADPHEQWTAAAIHFADPRRLFVSVRGRDCLSAFDVAATGLLVRRSLLSSGGEIPRDFMPVGAHLLVANQGSGEIRALRQGRGDRVLSLPAVHPTCICL